MKRFVLILAALICAFPLAAEAASSHAEQRAGIEKMEAETLAKLYAEKPDTKREIANAEGYAVFSNGSLALIWVSGGYGHGIARDNKNGSKSYMQTASAGVGLGLGAKDHNTVFVFHDRQAFRDFATTGLDLTGSADAAAKIGSKGDSVGGSADVLPGVRIYQLTDSGLIAQAMIQGTKYWPDADLNASAGIATAK
jgi:lipid-binding SYLF domain-containing protein